MANSTTPSNVSITAAGIQGITPPPVLANGKISQFFCMTICQSFLVVINGIAGYTNPSTGKPSFDGSVAYVVTNSKPLLQNNYFDLSSVPTSTPSASWQAVAAAWRSNQTDHFEPVDSISAVVCSPKYSIEPWIVDLVNGSMKLVQLQPHRVGNLDPTQLNIAIQDSLYWLPLALPRSLAYGDSIAQLGMLFSIFSNNSLPIIPYPSKNLTSSINVAIRTSVQAYLDNFPFGNFTPPESKLLFPALVLSADLNLICVTTALYALLLGAILCLFRRPVAIPLTIKNVLSLTREVLPPHVLDVSRGQAVATKIEHIATIGNDKDDSVTETRINKYIGDYYTIVREDPATCCAVLEVDSQQHADSPNMLSMCYENMRTGSSRITWAVTPALGTILVGFGIAATLRPLVASYSPQSTKATLFSALFTWGLGIWRSLSLLAVSSLIQQANSDVSNFNNKSDILAADLLASAVRNGVVSSNAKSCMA
jgi:hypothetical protein